MIEALIPHGPLEWTVMKFESFLDEPESVPLNVKEGLIIELEGWLMSSPKNCIGFTIITPAGYKQTTTLGKVDRLLRTVIESDKSLAPKSYNYVVDLGVDARDEDWKIPFSVNEEKVPENTGTWVFSKAKEPEETKF